jgi:hypothetical protein
MAKNETKHKSKYTAPKDMAKSQKPEVRSDLKDYIKDIVRDCMWEVSGEIQPGIRKDDKWDKDAKSYPFVHNNADGKDEAPDMVPDRKDADNAYPIKMMQDGDPKMAAHAKKAFEKNIEKDTEDYLEAMAQRNTGEKLKEDIKKLSESQKEQLVRKYIRNKIVKVLQEQTEIEPTEMPGAETPPAEAPAAEAPAAEAPPAPEVEADPEIDSEDAKKEKLKNIQKSPEYFKDYLEIHKDSMNIPKLIKVGLDPLLDTLQSLDGDQKKLAMRMIMQTVARSKQDYAAADLEIT